MDISALEENFERKSIRFDQIISGEHYFKNCKSPIWEYYQIKAWYELLINDDIQESKQAFSDAAKTDIYYYQMYNSQVSDLFSYGRTHVLEAALSDNELVINEYSKINYQLNKHGKKLVWHSDMVNDGEGHIYCALISSAMTANYEELNRLIHIAKTKCLKLKKNKWMKIDLEFFEGILSQDESKVEETITKLCTKEHKQRNKHSFLFKDIVSHPAQGYLKISWLNDMKIEIENKLIHCDLIPIQPKINYEDNVAKLMEIMITEEPPTNYNGQRIKK